MHLQRLCTRKIVGVGREADGWIENPGQGFTAMREKRVPAYPFVLPSGHAACITYFVLGDI